MRKVSWRIKLIGLFTVVLIASLLFQLFYVVPYARDREVDHAKTRQEEVALNIVREADHGLDNIENELISKVKKPESIAVSVTYTGEGIPEENMEKLFEPLFTAKAKGIGLGLTITKSLVEGNHGTIAVESEVGVGSTFTVNLPMLGKEGINEL